jgi:hypothetical protein
MNRHASAFLRFDCGLDKFPNPLKIGSLAESAEYCAVTVVDRRAGPRLRNL